MDEKEQLNMVNQNTYGVNREYKSSLFCMTFRDKEDLLQLCNAVNGTNYQNPDELIVYIK